MVDPDTSLNTGKPELSVQVDRPKAADLGVQIGDAAEALRLLVGGDQMNATLSWGGHPAVVLAILVATLVVGVGLMIVTHFRSRDLLAPPAGMAEKGRLRAREPLQ